jgi:two-component system chemotaxis response regulator CheY
VEIAMKFTSLRILIVDDNDLSCALLSVILRSDHYNIVGVAHDATTGIKMAQTHKPDVIFLDIVMPEISGLDAIHPIREILPNVAIVMVSGLDDNDLVTSAIQLGANGFIVKPFSTATVIGTIRKIREKLK